MLGIGLLQRRAVAVGARSAPIARAGARRAATAAWRPYATKAVEATDATFEKVVLEAPGPMVVDFYADWCRPCRMLAPLLEKAVESDGRVGFAKVDVDANQALAADYGVTSLPTVVGFRGGKPVAAFVGMRAPPAIASFIGEVVGSDGAAGSDGSPVTGDGGDGKQV
ncbi:hypothetical protein LPJ61_004726 [Coemansia biformis]|uniref:Thioredoxin domain-containing protein n=1 Tax=Coemansia biformis TaxID=1286918 RepID=A0A9W7YA47_9FUNG|nr:hypothetical protein LPJ61_004726 [Coemansia biformis]